MNAPFLPCGSVEDAAVDLIDAAARLHHARTDADRVAAGLDSRWAANRAARIGCAWRSRSSRQTTASAENMSERQR